MPLFVFFHFLPVWLMEHYVKMQHTETTNESVCVKKTHTVYPLKRNRKHFLNSNQLQNIEYQS